MKWTLKPVTPGLVGVFVLLLSGCDYTRSARYSIMSSRVVDASRIDLAHMKPVRGVEAFDTTVMITGFPLSGGLPSHEKVIDELLAKGGGDFVANLTFDVIYENYFFVQYLGFHVRGDVYNSTGAGSRDLP